MKRKYRSLGLYLPQEWSSFEERRPLGKINVEISWVVIKVNSHNNVFHKLERVLGIDCCLI